MRILHTGDLHLDSPFCAYGQKDADKQREAGRELLRRIFDCAKDEKCEMILIAGDLFDSRFVTPESAELFCTLVENCGIPVVLSPGNHDYYTENCFYSKIRARLDDKLTVFSSPELQAFDFDDLRVRVYGYAFTSIALTKSPLSDAVSPEDNGYIKLLCAHADLASPVSRYATLTLAEIERFGFDYAALGHIHNRDEREDSDGRVRYCGFAEGRSFDELGEGGVFVVDVDEDSCEAKRIVLSSRAFFAAEVSIPTDAEGVVARICNAIRSKQYPSGAHLRLTLTGTADSQTVKEIKSSQDMIRSEAGLEYIEIEDATLPIYDGKYLEKDVTVRGEIYRTLLPKLTSPDGAERKRAVLALKIALAAIDGNSVFDVVN
jgi:DNA repair exonuclease SbcCD nuclease subunit